MEVFWGRLNKVSDDAGAPQFNVRIPYYACPMLMLMWSNLLQTAYTDSAFYEHYIIPCMNNYSSDLATLRVDT